MVKLPILYKRTKTGKIVSYEIFTKVKLDNDCLITKVTGQLGGKKTSHYSDISKGKRGRTRIEQAESEAKSDWKKKLDGGYKSLEQLGFGLNEESFLQCSEEEQFNQLDSVMPKDNSDAGGNIKPMLAQDYHKHKTKVKFPCIVQPKLDGVRCLAVVEKGKAKLLSRSGKEYTVKHIIKALSNFPDGIYDGEIYVNNVLTFQDIVSAVKKENNNTSWLEYCIYDIINTDNQSDRLKYLYNIKGFEQDRKEKRIKLVYPLLVNDEKEISKYHDLFVKSGYEGLMVRNPEGLYEHSRSYNLLKYKQFDDDEFEFVAWVIGEREEDLMAICNTKEGKQFKATMVGSKKDKEELKSRKLKPGTLITVKYFGFTDEGKPRHAIGKAVKEDLDGKT